MVKKGRKLKKGYTVFKRSDSGSYAVRFTLEGYPQFRIGLGTFDEDEANELAQRKYLETSILAERQLLTGDASFDKLAREYVEIQFKDGEKNPKRLGHAKHASSTIKNYLIPYFGNKPITTIYHNDLMDYLDWRKIYWTEGEGKGLDFIRHKRGRGYLNMRVRHIEASPSTLKREASFLRGVFKHAVRQRHIKQGDVPKLELGRVPATKRPAFTREQYAKLILKSEQRLLEVQGNPKQSYERYMLHCFIVIAAESGMRPGELFNLDWGHVEGLAQAMKTSLAERDIRIIAQGKGKSPQRLVPTSSAINGFENLWHGYRTRFGRFPNDDDPVFCNYLGNRLGSLNNSLNALLDAANLRYDAVGEKFSAYCFRHSYATWQLQKSPPTDIYTLAKNMRTSVEMIEKWYSDAIAEDHAAQLRGNKAW